MKPLVKYLGLKESQGCSETMPNRLFVDKWDMCKKVNLNKSVEKFNICV